MKQKLSTLLTLGGAVLVLALLVSVSHNTPAYAVVTNSNGNMQTGTGSTSTGAIVLTANLTSSGAQLAWTKYPATDFKYYKIVRSHTNATPTYPADGYIKVVSDKNTTAAFDAAPYLGDNYYRVVVVRTDDSKLESNVVKLTRTVSSFSDLVSHWAERFVFVLKLNGILQGRDPSHFDPDAPVNRAEAVKIILKALQITEGTCNDAIFSDVFTNDWFCQLVTKAVQAAIVEGVNGKFYPGNPMNRAEAVKVLLLAKGIQAPAVTTPIFTDVPVDAWFAKYVHKAYDMGIVQGVGNNKFEPGRFVTRAELAKMAAILAGYTAE